MKNRALAAVIPAAVLLAACGAGEEATESAEEATATEPDEVDDEADEDVADYPTGAIEVVVPFDPGGGADNAQRVFNTYAEPLLDVPLNTVNRPGAGGAVGWAEFLSGPADGSQITIGAVPFNTLPAMLAPEETGYSIDDWNYVCIWGIVPDVIYVREGGPYDTLDDLLDAARENPRGILAGTTGASGTDALATFMLQEEAGVEFEQVAFSGDAESLQALLAGTIDVMFTGSSHVNAYEGELRPVAIATPERAEDFPDIPTAAEQGYPVESARYRSLAVHVDTPDNVVSFWEDICKQVSDDSEFQQAMVDQGQPPAFRNNQDANEEIGLLTERYQQIIDEQGLADS